MSQETSEWLHNNCLIGFTEQRGSAWWASRGLDSVDNNGEPNHYAGAIPLDDVLRRLPAFSVEAISVPFENIPFVDPYTGETRTLSDPTRQMIVWPVEPAHIHGVFKEGYQIHQFKEWLIDLAGDLLDTHTSDLGIANVVTLKQGAVAAVQFEVPENVKTKHGVEVRPSLLIATSMNGSLSTTPKRVLGNVVCDNTLAGALAEDGAQDKIKHSKNSLGKLDVVRAKLEIEFLAGEAEKELDRLCEIPVSGLLFKQFLTEWRKDKEGNDPLAKDAEEGRAKTLAEAKNDKLMDLWLNDDRVSPWAGTAFGVLQLTNTYNQQVAPTNKSTIRFERNMMEAASGKTAESDREALELLDKIGVPVLVK